MVERALPELTVVGLGTALGILVERLRLLLIYFRPLPIALREAVRNDCGALEVRSECHSDSQFSKLRLSNLLGRFA